ncbi:MAG: hypothetical protein WAT79_02850 [Saprospiraceae bacterium]
MFKTIRCTTLLVVLLPFLFCFSSCLDDFDPFSDLKGSRADIRNMLKAEDITQRKSIDSDNFTFISKTGVVVTAKPNSFAYIDGTIASGMIDFEMIELFTKSDILRYGIPTQTKEAILASDGEFLFKAFQNGQPLNLTEGKVLKLFVPNPKPNPEMELFDGVEDLWWKTNNTDNFRVIRDEDVIKGYLFSIERLKWVNIDYFTKFNLPLTPITISLPDGYQQDKISMWMVFRDLDVVLPASVKNLPIGQVVSIVCIAAEDTNTFRMDIKEVTIEEDLKVNLDPKEASAATIKKRLSELD